MSLLINNNYGTVNHIENSNVTINNGQLTTETSEPVQLAEDILSTSEPTPPPKQEVELTDGSLDQHLQLFKEAMLKVQNIKYSETKFQKLIAKTYDWYAVLRLGKDFGLLNSYDDMVGLMKEGKFNCIPSNPQNLNPYKKHILATTKYPDWTYKDQSSEPFFRKFKEIADTTYSIYCAGCSLHHIKPYGPGRK